VCIYDITVLRSMKFRQIAITNLITSFFFNKIYLITLFKERDLNIFKYTRVKYIRTYIYIEDIKNRYV